MKRIYRSPEVAEVALLSGTALLDASGTPPMHIVDDPDEEFNKDNDFTDWLSNKKQFSESEE